MADRFPTGGNIPDRELLGPPVCPSPHPDGAVVLRGASLECFLLPPVLPARLL